MIKETDNLVLQIIEDGYSIIDSVLSAEDCDEFVSILNNVHESIVLSDKEASSVNAFHNSNVKMVYNLHNKHSKFIGLVDHPQYIDIVKKLLKKGSYNNSEKFVLDQITARSPYGRVGKQQLHIDSNIPGSHVPLAVQVLIALNDFSIDNGATRIVPKSHKRQYFADNDVEYDDEVSVCIPKGSAVIFDAGLWHGGGEKTTVGDRWALILSYSRWFIKPTFDFNKNMPRKVYDTLTEQQKDLFGFKCNPPKDEYTRVTRQSVTFEKPEGYDAFD